MLYFFENFEFIDEFDIRIVHGDYPGSSYFGAELNKSIEEADAIAADLYVPIRSEWQGV